MGAQESHLASPSDPNSRPLRAYHVLRVAESSPASEAGIEPFFDYIVGIDGQQVTEDGETLANWLDEAEGKSITLQVYSSRKQEIRSIRTSPNRQWSSPLAASHHSSPPNAQPSQPSLLGLSLRLCSPQNALTNVWHVLDIAEGSPAQDAGAHFRHFYSFALTMNLIEHWTLCLANLTGLVPFGDWIIGYAGGILRGENDLYEIVEEYEGNPLRLFVYNADYEVTREVVIVPNRSWGTGEGLLGCSIGFGLLHRIPKTSNQTTAPSFLLPTAEKNVAAESDFLDEEEQKLLDQMRFDHAKGSATMEPDSSLNNLTRPHSHTPSAPN